MTDGPSHAGRTLKIWQQNLNKSLIAQLDLINNPDFNDADLAFLQEPHIDHLNMTRANSKWTVVYPTNHAKFPNTSRSVILVSTRFNTNDWEEVTTDSNDITAIRINTDIGTMFIFNIYNDCNHSDNLTSLNKKMLKLAAHSSNSPSSQHMIWAGDFNRHHPLWDEPHNKHLFTSENLDAAQLLIDLLSDYDLHMALPPSILTLRSCNTKNLTRPNNIFVSDLVLDRVIYCNAEPDIQPPCTDHFPIRCTISLSIPDTARTPRHNWKDVDWENFTDTLAEQLQLIPPPVELSSIEDFDNALANLQATIHFTMEKHVQMSKPSPFMKRWWTRELSKARKLVRKLRRNAYLHRSDRNHPSQEEYRM